VKWIHTTYAGLEQVKQGVCLASPDCFSSDPPLLKFIEPRLLLIAGCGLPARNKALCVVVKPQSVSYMKKLTGGSKQTCARKSRTQLTYIYTAGVISRHRWE
jgi:hypothetical protein